MYLFFMIPEENLIEEIQIALKSFITHTVFMPETLIFAFKKFSCLKAHAVSGLSDFTSNELT